VDLVRRVSWGELNQQEKKKVKDAASEDKNAGKAKGLKEGDALDGRLPFF